MKIDLEAHEAREVVRALTEIVAFNDQQMRALRGSLDEYSALLVQRNRTLDAIIDRINAAKP